MTIQVSAQKKISVNVLRTTKSVKFIASVLDTALINIWVVHATEMVKIVVRKLSVYACNSTESASLPDAMLI